MKLVFHTFAGIEERYLEYDEEKQEGKGRRIGY